MKSLQNRREFFKISAAGALGLTALGSLALKSGEVNRKSFGVGLQLYTIRDAMTADALGTLKKVSDLGYKNLELASYSNGKFYGFAPKEFKKIITDLGMEAISSHSAVESKGITIETAKIMADAHAQLGVKYCIQPWIEPVDRTIEKYKKMIGDWNKVGKIMKEVGIQFGYHNHNFEFANINGVVPYFDVFLPEMDKDLITMEIDLFWTIKAGHNPVDIFNKYPGRFQIFHLKDAYTKEAPFFVPKSVDMAPVGAGITDFKPIIAAGQIAGMKHLVVEQDCSFTDIRTCIGNLTSKILI